MNKICQVDLSTFCNGGCPWCRNSVMNRPKGFVKLELIEKLIKKIKGRQSEILLCFYGDPFLHPNFFEIVEMFYQNGIKTTAKTSDIKILTEENIEKIANSHLGNIYVTMNRFNPREEVEMLRDRTPASMQVTLAYINLPKEEFDEGILNAKELLAWIDEVEKRTGKNLILKNLPYNCHDKINGKYDCCMRQQNGDCYMKKAKLLSLDWSGKLFYCVKDYELLETVVGELEDLDNINLDDIKCPF